MVEQRGFHRLRRDRATTWQGPGFLSQQLDGRLPENPLSENAHDTLFCKCDVHFHFVHLIKFRGGLSQQLLYPRAHLHKDEVMFFLIVPNSHVQTPRTNFLY